MSTYTRNLGLLTSLLLAVAIFPGHAKAQTVDDCMNARQADALKLCKQVLDNGSRNADVYWTLSSALYQDGRQTLAKKLLKDALKLHPGNKKLLALQDLIASAITEKELIERSSELNQRSLDQGALKISCLIKSGKEAISACRRRLELTDDDGDRIRARLSELERIRTLALLAGEPASDPLDQLSQLDNTDLNDPQKDSDNVVSRPDTASPDIEDLQVADSEFEPDTGPVANTDLGADTVPATDSNELGPISSSVADSEFGSENAPVAETEFGIATELGTDIAPVTDIALLAETPLAIDTKPDADEIAKSSNSLSQTVTTQLEDDNAKQQLAIDVRRAVHKKLVKQIQINLNELGFAAGRPDGYPGNKTRTALSNFYSAVDAPVSKSITDLTLEHLQLEKKKLASAKQLLKQSENAMNLGDRTVAENRLIDAKLISKLLDVPDELERKLKPSQAVAITNAAADDAAQNRQSSDDVNIQAAPKSEPVTVTKNNNATEQFSQLMNQIKTLHGQIKRVEEDQARRLDLLRDIL